MQAQLSTSLVSTNPLCYNIHMVTDTNLKTKFKQTWRNVIYRCTNSRDPKFNYYNKKGICSEWLDYEQFEKDMLHGFVIHVDKYGLKDTTIERIDNSKGYSKENCTWATWEVQRANSIKKRKEISIYICQFCGKKIFSKRATKFCNLQCFGKSQRKYLGITKRQRWKEWNRLEYQNNLVYRERRKRYQRERYQRQKLLKV